MTDPQPDPCPTCRHNPGEVLSPPRGPMARWVPCPDCASPQPDTAPEGPWTAHGGYVTHRDGAQIAMPVGVEDAHGDCHARARAAAAALNGAPARDERIRQEMFLRLSKAEAALTLADAALRDRPMQAFPSAAAQRRRAQAIDAIRRVLDASPTEGNPE